MINNVSNCLALNNCNTDRLGIHNYNTDRLGIHNYNTDRLGIHNYNTDRLGIHNCDCKYVYLLGYYLSVKRLHAIVCSFFYFVWTGCVWNK